MLKFFVILLWVFLLPLTSHADATGMFRFEDCFVFQSTMTWKNFVYQGLSSVVSVKSRPADGNTGGMLLTPDVTLTSGVDYEIDIPNSRMRLLDTPLARQFVYAGGTNINGNLPRLFVTADFSGEPYAPDPDTVRAKAAKLSRWRSSLKTKDTLKILIFGDSTTYGQTDNDPSRWYNRWVNDIKSKYPNIQNVVLGLAAISGSDSGNLRATIGQDDYETDPATIPNYGMPFIDERVNTLLGGDKPDLVIVNYINDTTYASTTYYPRNVQYLIDHYHTDRGWGDLEFAVISGLKSSYTTYSEQLRQLILTLATNNPKVVAVDVTTLWQSLFSYKTPEDILANNLNHQNTMSTIAYAYEMGALIQPLPQLHKHGGKLRKWGGKLRVR